MAPIILSLLQVVLFSTFFIACKKPGGEGPDAIASEPIITAKGVSQGAATTKVIGSAGGELKTTDGDITIIIPAGAVATATTFSIEPITNTLDPEKTSRQAYRLKPEGTTFSKPVSIQFRYDGDDIVPAMEDALTVAWQTPTGTWKTEPASLDKAAKTITVETTHFSDWQITGGYELGVVDGKTTLKTGEKATLFIRAAQGEGDELALAPLSLADGSNTISSISNWKVMTGSGNLKPSASRRAGQHQDQAEYTAPATVNGKMDVEVQVEMDGSFTLADPKAPGGKRIIRKMVLLQSLVVADNFLTGTFGGEAINIAGANVVAAANGNVIVIRGEDNTKIITLSAVAQTAGAYPIGTFPHTGKSDVTVNMTTGALLSHSSFYMECGPLGNIHYSPSSLVITKWPAVGERAEGTFNGSVYKQDGTPCNNQAVVLNVKFSVVRSL